MRKRLLQSESGFTLVELLVTIAIMGMLFGVVTLALNGLSSDATANVKASELSQVQTAVDVYLAAGYPSATIAARTDATEITSTDSDADFKTYIRSLPTEYTYTWDTDGVVAQP